MQSQICLKCEHGFHGDGPCTVVLGGLRGPDSIPGRNAIQACKCGHVDVVRQIADAAFAKLEDAKNKPAARCVRCRSEFTAEQIEGKNACPECGDKGIPMHPDNDVTIKVNWHELRILTIWAENYANSLKEQHPSMIDAVFAIAAAIQDQHPDKGPITFSGEIRELRDAFPESKITVSGNVTEGAPMPEKWDETIDE